MRRILAILLPALLLLTACGGSAEPEPASKSAGETAKLASVKVTDNGDKKTPGLEFDKPLDVAEPTIKVVSEGSGDAVKANQVADVAIFAVDGKDGSTLEDTFTAETQPLEINDQLKTSSAIIYDALVGAKTGTILALAMPGQAAATGGEAQPTQLILIKVVAVKDLPGLLSSDETAKLDESGKLPKVTFDDNGAPAVEIPEGDAPDGLSVKVLEEGSGDKVAASDTIEANYTGWRWEGGEKFDSSYDRGEAATFPLNGVIQGWSMGLEGQKVGSKVLLTIPADLAYGASAAQQGKPAGPLVFVVEIVAKKL